MSWWRRHWRLILVLGVVGLGFVVLLILYILRKNEEAEQLKMELDLIRAGAKVDGLKADKAARVVELAKNDVARKALDAEIIAAKKAAVATVKAVEDMSNVDVAVEYRNLGY